MANHSIRATMEKVDDACGRALWQITLSANGVENAVYTYTSESAARAHLKNALAAAKKLEAEGIISHITTHRTRVQAG